SPEGILLIKIPEGDPVQNITERDRQRRNRHQERWPCSGYLSAIVRAAADPESAPYVPATTPLFRSLARCRKPRGHHEYPSSPSGSRAREFSHDPAEYRVALGSPLSFDIAAA